MRIGITYGTFDLFHVGHLNLLRRASESCDRLIVGVSTDNFNNLKGKESFSSFQDRIQIVEACQYVYSTFPEEHWNQKPDDIKKFQASIFFMGDDWFGKFDHLSQYCSICYLSRTPGISSTLLRAENKREIS